MTKNEGKIDQEVFRLMDKHDERINDIRNKYRGRRSYYEEIGQKPPIDLDEAEASEIALAEEQLREQLDSLKDE